jgi:NADH dehydrogenase FAD-containing subunit
MLFYYLFYDHYFNKKQSIVLLGDGFFARGFLHHIDYHKFHITQIYKDEFINPQDMMYNLDRNKKFDKSFHFRDLLYKKPDVKIKENITHMHISINNNINNNINIVAIQQLDPKGHINNNYYFDYLVIGLGANKSLAKWKDELNEINNFNYNTINKKFNINIDIIGMGPVGLELTNILSQKFNITMYDILPKEKVFNYVYNKELLFDLLDKKNVNLSFSEMYKNNNDNYNIFCVGSRPNILTQKFKPVNKYLQIDKNIYMGGDCATSDFIKTGQVAYQQGAYVAKRLNKQISLNKPFEYSHTGTSLHLGNKKVLIEGNQYLPDNVYPDFIIKMYSLFFI